MILLDSLASVKTLFFTSEVRAPSAGLYGDYDSKTQKLFFSFWTITFIQKEFVTPRTSISCLISTVLGPLWMVGSLFSSTPKFSGGRALREGFLLSEPGSCSNLRFRGVVLSDDCLLFFYKKKKNSDTFPLNLWTLLPELILTWGSVGRPNSARVLRSANSLASCRETKEKSNNNMKK